MSHYKVVVASRKTWKEIKTEKIEKIGELKSFLYGILLSEGLTATAYAGDAMIVQESGQPLRTWGSQNQPSDVEFLKRLKKSAYA